MVVFGLIRQGLTGEEEKWKDYDVRANHGLGLKHIKTPETKLKLFKELVYPKNI